MEDYFILDIKCIFLIALQTSNDRKFWSKVQFFVSKPLFYCVWKMLGSFWGRLKQSRSSKKHLFKHQILYFASASALAAKPRLTHPSPLSVTVLLYEPKPLQFNILPTICPGAYSLVQNLHCESYQQCLDWVKKNQEAVGSEFWWWEDT